MLELNANSNDFIGFKTRLIGTADQIAERIMLLKALGASILLTAFLHYEDEIELFGREVLPKVRELEKKGRGTDEQRCTLSTDGQRVRQASDLKNGRNKMRRAKRPRKRRKWSIKCTFPRTPVDLRSPGTSFRLSFSPSSCYCVLGLDIKRRLCFEDR